MEDVIYTRHGVLARLEIADIADEEFDFMGHIRHLGLVFVTHVVLLLLVATEDTNLCNVGLEETVEDGIPE